MKTTFAFGSVIFLAAVITSVVAVQTSAAVTAAQDSTAVRPFTVPIVSQAALDDLRRRIAATRWPERETVADQSQGVQLATMQKLASYWGKDYDWRKCEAKLKALPNFITTIDGLDIHTNMPNVIPVDLDKAAFSGAPAPAALSADEKLAYERLSFVYAKGIGYGFQMGLRPQTLYGIADSPVGLAAYFLDHDARSYELISRVFQGQAEGLTRDDILDNITITWLTNTALSGARLYWEYWGKGYFNAKGVSIPVAVSVFPDELYPAPRSWTEKAYPKLIHYNRLDKGGHFAAWEQPQLLSEEVRAGLRSLRSGMARAAA